MFSFAASSTSGDFIGLVSSFAEFFAESSAAGVSAGFVSSVTNSFTTASSTAGVSAGFIPSVTSSFTTSSADIACVGLILRWFLVSCFANDTSCIDDVVFLLAFTLSLDIILVSKFISSIGISDISSKK